MSEQAKKTNLKDGMFLILEGNLKRIFCTPIGHTTFREIQNVVFNCAENDTPLANFLFEILINGKTTLSITSQQEKIVQSLISQFMIPIRMAKEIHERGEFINFVSSDMIVQQDKCAFLNRLSRIDGKESLFFTDITSTSYLIRHLLGRLLEAEQNAVGKKNLIEIKDELLALNNHLTLLINNLQK